MQLSFKNDTKILFITNYHSNFWVIFCSTLYKTFYFNVNHWYIIN
jgi:hypothetical protein